MHTQVNTRPGAKLKAVTKMGSRNGVRVGTVETEISARNARRIAKKEDRKPRR